MSPTISLAAKQNVVETVFKGIVREAGLTTKREIMLMDDLSKFIF